MNKQEQYSFAQNIIGQLEDGIQTLKEDPTLIENVPETMFRRQLYNNLLEYQVEETVAFRIATQGQIHISDNTDVDVVQYLATEFSRQLNDVLKHVQDRFQFESVINGLSLNFDV